MSGHAAIVTGGLRGLGRAMALGLAEAGEDVLAVGHSPEDVPALAAALAGTNRPGAWRRCWWPAARRLQPFV